jgi:hypothetical protein
LDVFSLVSAFFLLNISRLPKYLFILAYCHIFSLS